MQPTDAQPIMPTSRRRPALVIVALVALAIVGCCALFGGDAMLDGASMAIAVSR